MSDLQILVDEAWCQATGWERIVNISTMATTGWLAPDWRAWIRQVQAQ